MSYYVGVRRKKRSLIYFEKERVKLLKKLRYEFIKISIKSLFILVLGLSITVFELNFLGSSSNIGSQILLVVTIVLLVRTIKSHKEKIREIKKGFWGEFKESFTIPFIEKLGFDYRKNTLMSSADMISSGLFSANFNWHEGDDFIAGNDGDCRFEFSDVRAENNYFKVFEGIFFKASFNKTINSRTYIVYKRSFLKPSYAISTMKLQDMDDDRFAKIFDVYSNNAINARYLITPVLMENFVAIYERFGCKINASFIDKNIFIRIDTDKNNFEPSLHRSFIKQNQLDEIISQIREVLAIIRELRLNKKIWNKNF